MSDENEFKKTGMSGAYLPGYRLRRVRGRGAGLGEPGDKPGNKGQGQRK